MSKQFNYDLENYSARDIVEFVKEKGYGFYLKKHLPHGGSGFVIGDTEIEIELPNKEFIERVKKERYRELFIDPKPRIYWQPINELYKKRYYAKQSGDIGTIKKLEEECNTYYKSTNKLFNQLKKKFQMKKDEPPQSIKDLGWLKNLEKYGYEKAEELSGKSQSKRKKIFGVF